MDKLPVLIIGAGISGLLLAHHLKANHIPFQIFERDPDMTTRGVGWGLTLHWSLPAVRAVLPQDLLDRLPECYVDRESTARGVSSRFPFLDLTTGDVKCTTPTAPETDRVRFTRQKLRELVATGIDIEWNKAFKSIDLKDDHVSVTFDDGSSRLGSLVVGCDGASSRVRRALYQGRGDAYRISIRVMGLKTDLSPEEFAPIREIDPFFMQGTAYENDSYWYLSVLDAPGNPGNPGNTITAQTCISWPYRKGFWGRDQPMEFPETNEARHDLMQEFAATWTEPVRKFIQAIPRDVEIKPLDLVDFAPPKDLKPVGRAILMGDALHGMAMYRGEGANHAIKDVTDFADLVTPQLLREEEAGKELAALKTALESYTDRVIERTRPAVFASRNACMDAHDRTRLKDGTPLWSRRTPNVVFDEGDLYEWE